MDVAYSAFLKQVGGKEEKTMWENCSLDDLCFRAFRQFDSMIENIFFKDITCWYLEECLVHVYARSIGGWLSLGM